MADPGVLAAQLIQKHWPKFGSIRKASVLIPSGNSDYNPSDGSVTTKPDVPIEHPLQIIFDQFPQTKVYSPVGKGEEPVLSIDRIAMFPTLDLSVVPQVEDQIKEVASNDVWKVVGLLTDPASGHYSLHVRPIRTFSSD